MPNHNGSIRLWSKASKTRRQLFPSEPSSTTTYLTKTAPGQVNPFQIILSNAPSSKVRYELTLSFQTSSVLDYQPITVLSQNIRDNFGVEVFGEVRNDQPKEMRSVEAVVTFYDASGAVGGQRFWVPKQ